MISRQELDKQLKDIHFNARGWGRTEAHELTNILVPGEKISDCVNGIYEGGFALLCATNLRVLLVDKKPMKFLTVEDLRFDMINELDYNHRLVGAHISISASGKVLQFTSYNQPNLRRLISYVQHRMIEIKMEQQDQLQAQQNHLEQMNGKLELYLNAQANSQFQHNQVMQQQAQALSAVEEQTKNLGTAFELSRTPFQTEVPTARQAQTAAVFEPQFIEQVRAEILGTQQPVEQPTQHNSPQQIGLSAAKRVLPVISAYTRLPLLSNQRR